VVKKIEGVEHVDNRIEVLPASSFDDRIRRDVFDAIYRYAPLQHFMASAQTARFASS